MTDPKFFRFACIGVCLVCAVSMAFAFQQAHGGVFAAIHIVPAIFITRYLVRRAERVTGGKA